MTHFVGTSETQEERPFRAYFPEGVGWSIFYWTTVIAIVLPICSQLWVVFILIPSAMGLGNTLISRYIVGFIILPFYCYFMWKLVMR